MYLLEEEKAKYEELTTEGKKLIEEKQLYLNLAIDERNIRVINIVITRDEDNIKKYTEAMDKVLKAKDATRQVLLLKKLDHAREKYESHLPLARFTTACCCKLAIIDQGFIGKKEDFLKAINAGEIKKPNAEDE